MKKKVLHFQMSLSKVEVRGDAIAIEGYASTPTIDSYNSIIAIESFKDWLENYRKNPIILLGHDDTKPIGTCDEYSVDDKGLRIKASITKNTDWVFDDIKEGRTKGFSIGFIPLSWYYIDKLSWKNLREMTEEEYSKVDYNDIVRVINSIDLVEISVVNLPANPQALFTISKALRSFFAEMETRKSVDIERRELIMPEDNPFIDQPVVEKKDTPEETEEEPKEEEEKEEEKPVEGTDPKSDIAEDKPQEEGEEPGETPGAPQEPAQTVEELKAKLEEERRLNEELLNSFDELEVKIKALESKLDTRAVNKPVLFTQQPQQDDQFVATMRKAKYGK